MNELLFFCSFVRSLSSLGFVIQKRMLGWFLQAARPVPSSRPLHAASSRLPPVGRTQLSRGSQAHWRTKRRRRQNLFCFLLECLLLPSCACVCDCSLALSHSVVILFHRDEKKFIDWFLSIFNVLNELKARSFLLSFDRSFVDGDLLAVFQ